MSEVNPRKSTNFQEEKCRHVLHPSYWNNFLQTHFNYRSNVLSYNIQEILYTVLLFLGLVLDF